MTSVLVWGSFLLFLVLLLLDVPIPFAILAGSICYAFFSGENLMLFAQKMSLSFADNTMLAIPAFLFVGIFMNEIGLTDRLFGFVEKWLGHITGGLAHANVLSSMIFAGMSGSVLADAGGLGVIEVATMKKAGYDTNFSVAITAASACIGPIIPPSINFLIWAYLSSAGAVTMFVAGVLPGLLMGLSLIAMNVVLIKFYHISAPRTRKFSWKERYHATVHALPAILGPVILIAGTMTGIFTPSECGSVAAVYCLIVGIYYKKLNLAVLKRTLRATLSSSAMVLALCAAGTVFNWMIITSGLVNVVSDVLMALHSKVLVLLILNVIMLILGCFMGSMQILIMLAPLLITLCGRLDISLVQMGVIAVFNLVIGSITPPFAPALFVTCQATNSSFNGALKFTCLFIIPLAITLLLITFIPAVTEGLPKLFGYMAS